MKIGMYIMEPEPISTAFLINPSPQHYDLISLLLFYFFFQNIYAKNEIYGTRILITVFIKTPP
jgi:hypothetical protein